MNYQLIMLPNPILVSDEEIKEGDWYIDFLVFPNLIQHPLQHSGVEYKEDKLNGKYKNPIIQSKQGTTSPKNKCWKIIAGLPELPQLDLSLVTDEIGYVDVVKLANLQFDEDTKKIPVPSRLWYDSQDAQFDSFIKGFNANPKKYTEEDMIEFYEWCDTSDEAAKFWRLKRVQPSMDGSHNIRIHQRRKELFQMWLEQRKPKVYNVEVEITNNLVKVLKIQK